MSLKQNFGWLALTVGLIFSVLLMWFGPLNPAARNGMPLLMALFMAELGFFVTLAGAITSIRKVMTDSNDRRSLAIAIGNILLAINLLYTGYLIWPEQGL